MKDEHIAIVIFIVIAVAVLALVFGLKSWGSNDSYVWSDPLVDPADSENNNGNSNLGEEGEGYAVYLGTVPPGGIVPSDEEYITYLKIIGVGNSLITEHDTPSWIQLTLDTDLVQANSGKVSYTIFVIRSRPPLDNAINCEIISYEFNAIIGSSGGYYEFDDPFLNIQILPKMEIGDHYSIYIEIEGYNDQVGYIAVEVGQGNIE